jgi:ribosomal protein S18 acetylase RimI-like enzyme
MRIRLATPADTPAITRMLKALAEHEAYTEVVNIPNVVLVAERRGQIVGTVSIFPPLVGLPKAQINNLWVDVEHRRKGIGTRLVEAAERFIDRHYDDAEIVFNVDNNNALGVAFWTALGCDKEEAA